MWFTDLYNDIAIYEPHRIHKNPFDGVSVLGFLFGYIYLKGRAQFCSR